MNKTVSCIFAFILCISGASVAQKNNVSSHHHHFDVHGVAHTHDDHKPSHFKKSISVDENLVKKQLDNKSGLISLDYHSEKKSFRIEEFKMYDGDVNPIPGMRTFRLYSTDNKLLEGRMMTSDYGVHVMYMDGTSMTRQYYAYEGGQKNYYEEYGFDHEEQVSSSCGVHEHATPETIIDDLEGVSEGVQKRFGNHKRVFRVAIVTSGEYYQQNGGSAGAAKAKAGTNLMDISFIYEREVNVQMVLASGSPRADWPDPESDPFTPSGSRTGMAGQEVTNRFTNSRYDIGHLFHTHPSGGSWLNAGGGSGGVAQLASVCRDGGKGNAWSGSFSNNGNGFIALAAHEFGHQYGANHTFNGGENSNCLDNIARSNNYEIASGVTIMSYNGTCGAGQNILSETNEIDDPAYNFFHAASLREIVNHLESAVASDCNTNGWTFDANTEPVANANPCGAVYKIPTRTPFFLRGIGTDEDGDTLTYAWEQYNNDPSLETQAEIGSDAAANTVGPIFRCYPPNGNPVRHFPKRGSQLEGFNSDEFEVLPTRGRSLRFRFIVRDNAYAGSAIDWDEINMTVVNNSFRVTAPDGTVPLTSGESVRVEWQIDGLEDICDKADIRVSVDGGSSFPFVVASQVDFGKGFNEVTIPASIPDTEQMRFQVICADVECFGFYNFTDDISFSSRCTTISSGICNTEPLTVDYREPELDLGNPIALGYYLVRYEKQVDNTPPTMSTTLYNANGTTCAQLSNSGNAFDELTITPTKSGIYHFEFAGEDRDIDVYSIFEKATFNTSSPCGSFVGSNSFASGSLNYGARRYMRVYLDACTEYILASQITRDNEFKASIKKIYGPGFLMGTGEDSGQVTFVAVDINDNRIKGVNATGNFITLDPGSYRIHSIVYDSGDPNSWIGSTISQITRSGDCITVSLNSKPVEINSSCAIINLTTSISTPCSSTTNRYDLTVNFEVDRGPSSGSVTINGQTFPFSAGNNTVVMTDLLADGQPVDLNFTFSADAGCAKTEYKVYTAPENCCNIDVELGDQRVCTGETAVLNAGSDGILYTWIFDGETQSETGPIFPATMPGNYEVIVQDIVGCEKSDMTEVSFDDPPIVEIVTDDVDDACSGDRVRIEGQVSNWDSISWLRNGQVEPDFENTRIIRVEESGRYELQAFNGGCMRSDFFNVTFLQSTPFNLGPDRDECLGTPITLDTGVPGLDYSWEKLNVGPLSSTSQTLEISGTDLEESGRYMAVGVSPNGCVFTDTIRVNYEEIPTIDLGDDRFECADVVINLDADISPIEWSVNGEVIVGYEFSFFSNPPEGEIVARFVVSDNCEASDAVIIEKKPLPDIELGPNMSFCDGEEIDTVLIGGERFEYEYTFFRNDVPYMGSEVFTGQLAVTDTGHYTLIAKTTDAGINCFALDEVVIEYVDSPTISLVDAPQAICTGEIETITVEASTIGIAWFRDGELLDFSEPTIEIDRPGTYEAFVGYDQDCEMSVQVVVDGVAAPSLGLPPTAEGCEGSSVPLEATTETGLIIRWLFNRGLIAGAQDGTYLADEPGEYICIAQRGSDCPARDTVIVTFTDAAFVILPDDQAFCEGDIGMVTADTDAASLTWYNGNLQLPDTGPTIEVTAPGTYRAVASEGQDCEASDEITIRFGTSPDVMITDDSQCQGVPAEFVAGQDGEFVYSWTVGGNPVSGSSGTLMVNFDDIMGNTAEVTVNVKNLDDDCSTESSATVTFIDGSTLEIIEEGPYCNGTPARLTAETNVTELEWYKNGVKEDETGLSLEIFEDGEYLAVAGTGSCSARDSVRVTFSDSPDIMLGSLSPCASEDAVFVAGPDEYEYTWTVGGVMQTEESGTLTVTSAMVPPGTVEEVIVTAKNRNDDCSTTLQATVEFIDSPELMLIPPDEACNGTPAVITTTTNVMALKWFKGGVEEDETGTSLEIFEDGEYLAVAGEGACAVRDSIMVTFADSPEISLSSLTRCASEDAVFVAGTDDYEYTWTIGGVEQMEESGTLTVTTAMVPPGTVEEVVVTAKNIGDNCSTTLTATVEFVDSPELALIPPDLACNGSAAVITTMTNVSALRWFNGGVEEIETGTSLEIFEDGEYLAIAGDGDCAARDSIIVTFSDSPEIELTSLTRCSNEDAVFIAGPDDYEYTWTVGGVVQMEESGTLIVTSAIVPSGTVEEVSVTAKNRGDDCSTTLEATVEFLDSPELELIPPDMACRGESAFINANTNVSALKWYLGGVLQGETGVVFEATEDGEYLAIAGDGSSCAVRDSIEVVFSDSPAINLESLSRCANEEAVFVAGPDIYEYTWTVGGVEQMETSGTLTITSAIVPPGIEEEVVVIAKNTGDDCYTTLSATVEFIDSPTLELIPPDEACNGTSAIITTTTNVSSLEWYKNGALEDEMGTSLEIFEDGEYLAVAGGGNCAARDSIIVTFADTPDISLASQTSCSTDDAVFVAGPDIYEYTWTVGGVDQMEESGTLIVTSTMVPPGTVEEIVVVAKNVGDDCSTTLTATVEFVDSPELALLPPDIECKGQTATITTTTNVNSLQWFRNGVMEDEMGLSLDITEDGEYLAVAGNGNCVARDSIQYNFADSPELSIDGMEQACAETTVDITLTSDTNEPVVWMRGTELLPDDGNVITVDMSGTYTAEVTNADGCATEVSHTVEFFDLPTADILNLPSGVCEGQDYELEAESDGARYEWYDDNNNVLGTGLTQEFNLSGDYRFVAYNEIDCATEFPFTLEFKPAPVIDLGPDQSVCSDETVTLTVPQMTDVTYQWFLGGVDLGEDGNSIEVTESGVYECRATNDIDCVGSDEVRIDFIDYPTLTSSGGPTDVTLCEGGSETLTINTDSNMITWRQGNTIIDQDVIAITVTMGGIYTVEATTQEGCSTFLEFDVEEIPTTPIDDLEDLEFCPGAPDVPVTIMGDFDTYEWTGAIMGNSATESISYTEVTEVTTRTVNVSASKGGCASLGSFDVTYYPPVIAQVDQDMFSICAGESVQLGISGGTNYTWTDSSGTLSCSDCPDPTATPDQTVTYTANIASDDCPDNEEIVSVTVNVNPLPFANAGLDQSTILGESVMLEASGGTSYQWDNTDLILGSSNMAEIEVEIEEETSFTVIVTDNNGCSASDDVLVSVVDDPSRVINVINAFSPNGDNTNDVLEFDGLSIFPDNHLTIFNRWGNVVFEKRGYQRDDVRWDGTRNGEELPAATYYYILEFGDFKVKNSLTIIRD